MTKLVQGLNEFSSSINQINDDINKFGQTKEQGFAAPNAPGSDIGLPFTKVHYNNSPVVKSKRHLIHWFIPDMGTVKMFVNPENIQYENRKAIRSQRTKGGYNVQYWGEELPTMTISGTTGSSGIEGINALYEIYRSEQYTFDSVGMTISSNNAAENAANNIFSAGVNKLTSGLASTGIGGAIAGGLLGAALTPQNSQLAGASVPSLANNALTVEMYYMGWVFRGYFTNMSITESSSDLLFRYSMSFTVTQRRGYRTNFFPWHQSPANGGGDLGNHYERYDNEGLINSSNYSFGNK